VQYEDPLTPAARAARTARTPEPQRQAAVAGLVLEHGDWCGALVSADQAAVELEDRHGRRRSFPYGPGFLLDGRPVVLTRPHAAPAGPRRSASGSTLVDGLEARVARDSRIWVEGRHDAELVERVWGHDLRVEGVVVEPLDGIDDLAAEVRGFRTGPGRRLGVLVDHLVPGSKETRIVAGVRDPHTLVLGHPYVDVWQAVKPAALRIPAWPVIPPGRPWKEGVCAALGWGETWQGWRRVLAAVDGYADVEVPLLRCVEELVDWVTADAPEVRGA